MDTALGCGTRTTSGWCQRDSLSALSPDHAVINEDSANAQSIGFHDRKNFLLGLVSPVSQTCWQLHDISHGHKPCHTSLLNLQTYQQLSGETS